MHAPSQFNGRAFVAAHSSLVRCRSRAPILVVLATFGVVCHAQMTPQDASGITSCEAELAKCQAVLGAKEAKDIAPLTAVTAESGTPSSESEGARLRSSLPPIRLACTGGMRKDARAVRVRAGTPCCAGSSSLVGINTSGAVPPADGAQYQTESNATSCAAMLRDCQAHSRARLGATSPGEPRPVAPYLHIPIRSRSRRD
jgi:hypothetical protein